MNSMITNQSNGQYSLVKILGIWLLAAVPMGILGWVVAPALSPDFKDDPIGAAITRIGILTIGLIWQFVLAMIIVRREEGDLRWSTIKTRLWLNKPRDPKTGQPRGVLWLWAVLFLVTNASVKASSSIATVNASGRLDVDASSSSNVYDLGNPTLGEIDTSTGSSVEAK